MNKSIDLSLSLHTQVNKAIYAKSGYKLMCSLFQQYCDKNPEAKDLSLIQFLQDQLKTDNIYHYLSGMVEEGFEEESEEALEQKVSNILTLTAQLAEQEWLEEDTKSLNKTITDIDFPDNQAIRDAMTRGYVMFIAKNQVKPDQLSNIQILMNKHTSDQSYYSALNALFARDNNLFSFLIGLYATEINEDSKINLKKLMIELVSDQKDYIKEQTKDINSDSLPPIIHTINQMAGREHVNGLLAEIEKELNLNNDDLYEAAQLLVQNEAFEKAFSFIFKLLIDKKYFKVSGYTYGYTYRSIEYVQLLLKAYETLYLPKKQICSNLNDDLLKHFLNQDADEVAQFYRFIYTNELVEFLMLAFKNYFSNNPQHYRNLLEQAIKEKAHHLQAIFTSDLVEKLLDEDREAIILELLKQGEFESIVIQLIHHTQQIKPATLKEAIHSKASETVISELCRKVNPLRGQFRRLKPYINGNTNILDKLDAFTGLYGLEPSDLMLCLSQPFHPDLTLIEHAFKAYKDKKSKANLIHIKTLIDHFSSIEDPSLYPHWYEVIGLQQAIVTASSLSDKKGRKLLRGELLNGESYLSFNIQFILLKNMIRLGQDVQAIQLLRVNLSSFFKENPDAYKQLINQALDENQHAALSCLLDEKGFEYLDSDALLTICDNLIRNHGGHDSAYFFSKLFLACEFDDTTKDILLRLAAQYRKPLIAQFLLEQGANPNRCDEDGMTGMHWAAHNNLTKLLIQLNQHGADYHIHNRDGQKPNEMEALSPYNRDILNKIIHSHDRIDEGVVDADSEHQTFINLAFRGGGAKGAAYPSALVEAETLNLFKLDKTKGVSGASAGAITAALVAIGFSAIELETIMDRIPMTDFMDADPGNENILEDLKTAVKLIPEKFASTRLPTGVNVLLGEIASYGDKRVYDPLFKAITTISSKKGLFNGHYFIDWLSDLFVEKLRSTNLGEGLSDAELKHLALHLSFSDLDKAIWVKGGRAGEKAFKYLRVVATDISRSSSVRYSSALTPNATVIDAVRASMSYPIAFKPHQYYEIYLDKYGKRQKRIPKEWENVDLIDGGVMDNYPVRAFDDDDEINPQTLGFYLATEEEKLEFEGQAKVKVKPIQNGLEYLTKLLGNLLGHQEYSLFRMGSEEDAERTIFIDDTRMGALDFDANDETLSALKDNGRKGVHDFYDRLVSHPKTMPLSIEAQKLLLNFAKKNAHEGVVKIDKIRLTPLQIVKVYARCNEDDLPLLNRYINPNTRDEHGNTPLHIVWALIKQEQGKENPDKESINKLQSIMRALYQNNANKYALNLNDTTPRNVEADDDAFNGINFERVHTSKVVRNLEKAESSIQMLTEMVEKQQENLEQQKEELIYRGLHITALKEISETLKAEHDLEKRSYDEHLEALKKQITQLQALTSTLKSEILERDHELITLKEQVKTTREEYRDAEAVNAEKFAELKANTQIIEEHKRDLEMIIEERGDKLSALEEKVKNAKTKKNNMARQNEKQQIEIARLKAALDERVDLDRKIEHFSFAHRLMIDIRNEERRLLVISFLNHADAYIDEITQTQFEKLYRGLINGDFELDYLDDVLRHQTNANAYDREPELINVLFSPSFINMRISFMRCIFQGIIEATQTVIDHCLQGYVGLIKQFGCIRDVMQKTSESQRAAKLSKIMQPIKALTHELSLVAKPSDVSTIIPVSESRHQFYQSTILDYEKQYQKNWWVNQARRQQANLFFRAIKESPVHEVLVQIRQLQHDILLNDEKNAKNNKGYSRLFDISQQLNIQICADILVDDGLPLAVKQQVINHLDYQKATIIGALLNRLPPEQSELKEQLQYLANNSSLDNEAIKDTISHMERVLPKNLRYLIPIIKGHVALYELNDISGIGKTEVNEEFSL